MLKKCKCRCSAAFFLVCGALSLLPVFCVFYALRQEHRRKDPRAYYGELKLVEPIDGGFSYLLDGGSIVVNLSDRANVRLDFVCSPPGGYDGAGDILVYAGSPTEVPGDSRVIERAGEEAVVIARFVESSIPSMKRRAKEQMLRGDLDSSLVQSALREQIALAERVVEILTTNRPMNRNWGPSSHER